jgi:hypothetical protein
MTGGVMGVKGEIPTRQIDGPKLNASFLGGNPITTGSTNQGRSCGSHHFFRPVDLIGFFVDP